MEYFHKIKSIQYKTEISRIVLQIFTANVEGNLGTD